MGHADAARRFWNETTRYHDLAITYEQNITMAHPERAKGECQNICGRCTWAASAVDYPTYTGPRATSY